MDMNEDTKKLAVEYAQRFFYCNDMIVTGKQ